MTIILDGQPLDAAVVVCTHDAIEIRRVLDMLRQRSVVAQQARSVQITAQLTPVTDALTEHFERVPREIWQRPDTVIKEHFDQETHGHWQPAPIDAQIPVPLSRPPEQRPTPLLGWRRRKSY